MIGYLVHPGADSNSYFSSHSLYLLASTSHLNHEQPLLVETFGLVKNVFISTALASTQLWTVSSLNTLAALHLY